MPSSKLDDFPDEPPEPHPLLEQASNKIRAEWEMGKRLKDEAMKRRAELEETEKESQVQVRVTWRSKLGVWGEHFEKTG